MQIPDDMRESLDVIEQSLGELILLRAVIKSIADENPELVTRHAEAAGRRLGVTAPTKGGN